MYQLLTGLFFSIHFNSNKNIFKHYKLSTKLNQNNSTPAHMLSEDGAVTSIVFWKLRCTVCILLIILLYMNCKLRTFCLICINTFKTDHCEKENIRILVHDYITNNIIY